MRTVVAFLFLALMLAACGTAEPPPQRAPLRYDHLPPLRFDVGAVDVEVAYQSPLAPPNVEHRFTERPADAAAQLGRDRLVAAGSGRRMIYHVLEASVVELPLAPGAAYQGSTILHDSLRFDGKVRVEVRIVSDGGVPEGEARVGAERSIVAVRDIEPKERERIQYEMTRDLTADLNRQLEATLREVFAKYLLP